jgi:hypothetical protein
MLYVIHCENDPDLAYRGGQGPIIHLEADLHQTINWADEHRRLWAFSLSNAGAHDAQFRSSSDQLDEVKWSAVAASDFREAGVKNGKQAEFLLHYSFPWKLVERVGVRSPPIAEQVASVMHAVCHKPRVEILSNWYY